MRRGSVYRVYRVYPNRGAGLHSSGLSNNNSKFKKGDTSNGVNKGTFLKRFDIKRFDKKRFDP